jgi:hypothetical protein
MALTITKVDTWHNLGDVSLTVWDITLDASYPSGGYSLGNPVGNTFGLSGNLLALVPCGLGMAGDGVAQPAHNFMVWLDTTNRTLRVFGMAAAAGASTPLLEVSAAANLTGYKVRVLVFGY